MPDDAKYLQQYRRVQRWYQRFRDINSGRLHTTSSDKYEDEVYAFFMNCYHLKDWIKNDAASDALASKVEDFINSNAPLQICADLCNGLKHLTLTRDRSGQQPRFGKRFFKAGVGTRPTTLAVEYSIDTANGALDAFELATQCVDLWSEFLDQ